jgi:PBSX family phage terminase large subunit
VDVASAIADITAEYGTAPTVFHLTPVQGEFWHCTDRYQDLEGAVRSGKTTVCLLKVGDRCEQYPGLQAMVSRWHDSDTRAQLKARFEELFGGRCRWESEEQYFEFPNGSRVYVRGLKPGEGASLFSKFAGLNLALIYIDQPEEMPHAVFQALKARLSQPGYPHEMYLSPNPPDEDHWLAEEFPLIDAGVESVECRPGYRYIRTTVHDNVANLDPDYIPQLEADYPAGHVLRRRFIEGKRGLSVVGVAVYRGYFDRARHLLHEATDWQTSPSTLCDRSLPIFESWDFGHSSPCVTWHQVQRGGAQWVILGGVQGRNMFLEDFAPAVLDIRARWFPALPQSIDPFLARFEDPVRARRAHTRASMLNVQTTGDPAGATNNSQGTNRSAVSVLADMGIYVTTQPDANHPERRNFAIQTLAGFMDRAMSDGSPCFTVSDRFLILSQQRPPQARALLVDGLEAGYVWDALSQARTASPNTRRPKKDGVFDHGMNTCEYAALAFAPAAPATRAGVFYTDGERLRAEQEHARQQRRDLRAAQRDDDPYDRRSSRVAVAFNRGGGSRGGYA